MGFFALLMLPFFTSAQVEMLDQVVAIVDDDIILASELQERVQGVRSTMESRGVEVPEDDILIRETLDRLILDSIQLQLANLYGVRIPDQQLDESMTRLAQQNGLTLEQFRLALEQSGQSYAAAREGSGMTWRSSAFSKATSCATSISRSRKSITSSRLRRARP